MTSFAEIVFVSILLIPLYLVLIWSYLEPEQSILLGKRWKYTEEPEQSKKAHRYTKFTSMTTMIAIPFVLLGFLTSNNILSFIPLIFIFILVFGALKIFISVDHS